MMSRVFISFSIDLEAHISKSESVEILAQGLRIFG